MQTVKEKVSNAASSGKAYVDVYKAKAEEKAEKATVRSEEEKEIAHQRRKAKEAKAKMELHQAKAERAAEKLRAKQSSLCGLHHHHDPKLTGTKHGQNEAVVGQQTVGPAATMAGITVPTYPLGGKPPPGMHNKHIQRRVE